MAFVVVFDPCMSALTFVVTTANLVTNERLTFVAALVLPTATSRTISSLNSGNLSSRDCPEALLLAPSACRQPTVRFKQSGFGAFVYFHSCKHDQPVMSLLVQSRKEPQNPWTNCTGDNSCCCVQISLRVAAAAAAAANGWRILQHCCHCACTGSVRQATRSHDRSVSVQCLYS